MPVALIRLSDLIKSETLLFLHYWWGGLVFERVERGKTQKTMLQRVLSRMTQKTMLQRVLSRKITCN